MAINKNKNVNLQLTISKQDSERLLKIQEQLSALLGVEITKSQTIAFLIKNYEKAPRIQEPKQKPNRAIKENINYQSQILALKDKINVSYPKLSQIIGIPTSTLKKYASGTQQPQGENEQLLNDALKRYGIK